MSRKNCQNSTVRAVFKYFVRKDEILIIWFSSTLEVAMITAFPLQYLWAGREILG